MSIANRFFRSAVTFAVLGMAGGIYMGLSEDHSQMPAHVHVLLIGWVSMFLFGAFYRLMPTAAGQAAAIHWWLVNLGVVTMVPGLVLIFSGTPEIGGPLAIVGSLVVFGSTVLFAAIVYGATGVERGALRNHDGHSTVTRVASRASAETIGEVPHPGYYRP